MCSRKRNGVRVKMRNFKIFLWIGGIIYGMLLSLLFQRSLIGGIFGVLYAIFITYQICKLQKIERDAKQ